jgi:hypothetical protein
MEQKYSVPPYILILQFSTKLTPACNLLIAHEMQHSSKKNMNDYTEKIVFALKRGNNKSVFNHNKGIPIVSPRWFNDTAQFNRLFPISPYRLDKEQVKIFDIADNSIRKVGKKVLKQMKALRILILQRFLSAIQPEKVLRKFQ